MNTVNIKLYELLLEWDPFQIGGDSYDPEYADIIGAVNEIDEQNVLARRIQHIFEFSFEKKLPLEECLQKAKQLLDIKNEESCSFN
jgi:hypothetical protein